MPQAVAIGIIGGTKDEPRMRPLQRAVPVTDDLLRLAQPVLPTEVFRFAAPCITSSCEHFVESTCQLAAKIVRLVPETSDGLPTCSIRPRCRWFIQEGRAACIRCPQVATNDANRPIEIAIAADPSTPVPH